MLARALHLPFYSALLEVITVWSTSGAAGCGDCYGVPVLLQLTDGPPAVQLCVSRPPLCIMLLLVTGIWWTSYGAFLTTDIHISSSGMWWIGEQVGVRPPLF